MGEARETRIKFYLGKMLTERPTEIKGPLARLHWGDLIRQPIPPGDTLEKPYYAALRDLLRQNGWQKRAFAFEPGDVETDSHPLVLAKVRGPGCQESVILRSMEFHRHWRPYYDPPEDLPFDRKLDMAFWRGATTGRPTRPGNRFLLVHRWFRRRPDISVAFSHICQCSASRARQLRPFMDGGKPPPFMLRHKYIISAEGNDKDSGLQWKLNSNSVVLMPRPRAASWLMETTLVPGHHYVLVRDDFADLGAKVDWCRAHPAECNKIVANAKRFMSQFADDAAERELEREVLRRYFDVAGKLGFSPP